jgi:flagellar hook-associated protein 1 FlgK
VSSINQILNSASSGLYTAQTGIGVVSNNIANINTAGYVTEQVDQNSTVSGGVGTGVNGQSITLAANQYLQNASLGASADAGSASIISSMLTQAQGLFGDPGQSDSYLNQLSQVFTDFSSVAADPSNSIGSTQAVDDLSHFLNQSGSIATSLSQLGGQADTQLSSDVNTVNSLLSQIAQLNTGIIDAQGGGASVADIQNTQGQLITQLSSLLDVKASTGANGAVTLRSTTGATLVGMGGAATLSYTPVTNGASQVQVVLPGGSQSAIPLNVGSGEIGGLLNLRNTQLPGVSAQLSSYVTGAVSAINQASNASSSVPPPNTLTGSNIGIDLTTAISGFSGTTNIAVVNSTTGVTQQQIAVDFSTGQITDGSGNVTGFTPSTFLSSLNTALGGNATASFSNGVLSITAQSGTGVAIQDSSPGGSQNAAGLGFSQYFGLNNLVTSNAVTNYNTGLSAASPDGFTPGGTISLQLMGANGAPITDETVTMPAGATMQDVLNSLNSTSNGVGLYGQFALSSTGQMTFNPYRPGTTVAVLGDNTQWGANGASLSGLFGIGGQASIAGSFLVRADIAANPAYLQTATLNLGAATGQAALLIGDGSGATALANAGSTQVAFGGAGPQAAITTTATQYGAQLGGSIGDQAAAASNANSEATAVQSEANSQLQSTEGVNLDQELVKLTTYQQAYSASARLIAATQAMFTALMNIP